MASSLRLKLVLSYVALVFVILTLAAIASGSILTSTQRSLGYNRAQNTILVLAQRVRGSRSPRQTADSLLQFGTGLRGLLLSGLYRRLRIHTGSAISGSRACHTRVHHRR